VPGGVLTCSTKWPSRNFGSSSPPKNGSRVAAATHTTATRPMINRGQRAMNPDPGGSRSQPALQPRFRRLAHALVEEQKRQRRVSVSAVNRDARMARM